MNENKLLEQLKDAATDEQFMEALFTSADYKEFAEKLNENNEFSFDAILDEEGIESEGYDSSIPESDTDYLDDDYAEGFNDAFDYEDDKFDFDKMEDERIHSENPTVDDIFSFNDELFDDAL